MKRSILCAAVLVLVSVGRVEGAIYSVTDLGTLGGTFSVGKAVNSSGQVVGYSDTGSETHAFLYSGGVMTDIGGVINSHNFSIAHDINNFGQVAGHSSTDGSDNRAFHYFNGTMTDLGNRGGNYAVGRGINNDGDVVGISADSGGVTQAFLYSNGTIDDLGSLGGYAFSDAFGVNDLGVVVGNAAIDPAISRAFVWQNNSMDDLGDLENGNGQARAYAINNGGQVVGESTTLGSPVGHAVLWQGGSITDLGVLLDGSDSSYADDINNQGTVVGRSYSATSMRAFVWDNTSGMRDLNSLVDSSGVDWTLTRAVAIGDTGYIVAQGISPSGEVHAALLTPIPEPSTVVIWSILGAIGIGCGWRRRRRA